MSRIRFDILTTFPELFAHGPEAVGGALNSSIPARARAAGLVEWHAANIRSFAGNKHNKTDDRPFGGGPGMVMMCQPVYDAVLAVEALDPRPATRILLTPQGRPLTQPLVEQLATKPRLLLIAGHYEGLDERVIEKLAPLELSLGDYVLSGGELGAMVLMDAIIRLLPGALGHEDSASQDSFSLATLPTPKGSTRPHPNARSPTPNAEAEAPPSLGLRSPHPVDPITPARSDAKAEAPRSLGLRSTPSSDPDESSRSDAKAEALRSLGVRSTPSSEPDESSRSDAKAEALRSLGLRSPHSVDPGTPARIDAEAEALRSLGLCSTPSSEPDRSSRSDAEAEALRSLGSVAPKVSPTPRPLRLLDCPHYTKPREWMGMSVPDVLLSGDHAAIEQWRFQQRLARTQARRPDLLPPLHQKRDLGKGLPP